MRRMVKQALSLTVAVAALFGPAATAHADREAGRAKAKQLCASCHGEDGNKALQPDFPILAGQYSDYLFKALRDYKSGARKNAIMQAQVQNLSRQDLQDLAEWFAAQKGPLHVRR
jgi:cytochrome c553